MNINRRLIWAGLRGSRPLFASHRVSVNGKRALFEAFTGAARAPKGTRFDRLTIAGVPVERVEPPTGGTNGTLIYLHGGAYALGSAKGYRGLVAHLAAAAGMTAIIPDYSRAPEARYPVALEEMVAVYSQLLDDGLHPESTVVAGDSAGGGLALALAMTLRDRGLAAPVALGLICPWANLAIDIEQLRPKLRDPLVVPSMTAAWASTYAGTVDPMVPGISPVYGNMTNLPPIVVHSAGDDPLRCDSSDIARAVSATGTGAADHRVFDGLWHVFHLQVSVLPEARDAVADLGAKLRTHVQASDIRTNNVKVAVK
jgi:monoterpene epsilon-lactone hydrolase